MTKIIELAHALGEEIARSDEIKNLEAAKGEFQSDAELQNKMNEYEGSAEIDVIKGERWSVHFARI